MEAPRWGQHALMVRPNAGDCPALLRSATTAAAASEKPWRLVNSMYDSGSFRPLLRSLSDALAAMNDAAFNPIGELRGGACDEGIWLKRGCALTWIEGETACERFRVAIPTSTEFAGWDKRGHRHRRPIKEFDGALIKVDGSLQLKDNSWIQRVRFIFPRLTFLLTHNQQYIAQLVNEFQRQTGYDLPICPVDYAGLAETTITSLGPVTDYIRSRWRLEVTGSPPPSGETIASTLEALFIRPRRRDRYS